MAAVKWIESLPDDRSEDRAETVAHHYVTAIDLFHAAGENDPELRARAANALLTAGERSLLLHAYPAAARFLEQALDLLPDEREPSPELLFAAGTAFGYVGRSSDELARAVDGFERAGDPERAAEAAVMASRHGWHALSDDVDSQLKRAAELVEGRPVSRVQALVVSEQARRSMLTFRPETGMALAMSAIELARDVHDVEIEAHALVSLGCARVSLGDSLGVQDIERALELVGRRGTVAGRALTNLGWAYEVIGDLRRALAVTEQAVEFAEQGGDVQSAWFARGNLVITSTALGDWDEALACYGLFEDAPEGARYMHFNIRTEYALILAARDRGSDALDELRDVLEFLASMDEEQATWHALLVFSSLARRRGMTGEATAKLDELMRSIAAHESVGDPSSFQVMLGLELVDAGRATEAHEIVSRLTAGTWHDACAAVVERQFAAAADIVDSAGEQSVQADLRLRAARDLIAQGRHGEAQEQLERARAFWRRVGATAYLREADELLAAAS